MASWDDPYKELETYLKTAEEEVSKAEEEIKQHQVTSKESTSNGKCNEDHDPYSRNSKCSKTTDRGIKSVGTVNRVCHDGNVLDINKTSSPRVVNGSFQKPTPYFSKLRTGICNSSSYSPNTKRRLWQMHSSLSFPEGSKDLLLLKNKLDENPLVLRGYSNGVMNGTLPRDSCDSLKGPPRTEPAGGRFRQRSYSECSTLRFHDFRSPNNNANLMTTWVDSLKLELDQMLSDELKNFGSFSPSSDYSLSPSKQDDTLTDGTSNSSSEYISCSGIQYADLLVASDHLKPVSLSPDSGIDHTSEVGEDYALGVKKWEDNHRAASYGLLISCHELDSITPTPDDDKTRAPEQRGKDSGSVVNAADFVHELHETEMLLEEAKNELESIARALPAISLQLDDCVVVSNTCAINESTNGSSSSSLPDYRSHKSTQKTDQASCSLPRAAVKSSARGVPMRSASASAVANVANTVTIDELAAFLQRIKTSPPSSSDVSTDIKSDIIKDAVTQTIPLTVNRSSSFTWVTECDCGDWGSAKLYSGSEDSLVMGECSACKAEAKNEEDSSSSLDISSDDDEYAPGSANSSLYLSACTGSSDSFEDVGQETMDEPVVENGFIDPPQLASSNATLRASVLDDIAEENATNDVKASTNKTDPLDESMSTHSTLKASRSIASNDRPTQPIEPKVLIVNELNQKSISAPVLRRNKSKIVDSSSSDSSPPSASRFKPSTCEIEQTPPRSHSAKELNELQAIEACGWLRAAGFPQYAQMYEDNQFPIDIGIVQKDHAFLHPDSIQSLFRRLNTLNRCARMKFMDNIPRKSLCADESDDEEQCALSENWQFQRTSKRWSRIPSASDEILNQSSDLPTSLKPSCPITVTSSRKYLTPEEAYCSSHDSVFIDEQHSSPESIKRAAIQKIDRSFTTLAFQGGESSPCSSSGSGGTLSLTSMESQDAHHKSLHRSGSDRVKEGAKALLKRMESLKGKKKKKPLDGDASESSTKHSGTDEKQSSSLTSSPNFLRPNWLTENATKTSHKHKKKGKNILGKRGDDVNAHSDSECPVLLVSQHWQDAQSNDIKHFISKQKSDATNESTSRTLPTKKDNRKVKKNSHKFSQHSERHLKKSDIEIVKSPIENICAPLVAFNVISDESNDKIINQFDPEKLEILKQPLPHNENIQNLDEGEIIIINTERRDSGVGSSLTRGVTYQQAPWHCFPGNSSAIKQCSSAMSITNLTSPQILLLKKLSLLKLTTVMEKFSPPSRSDWSWLVSKFMRRIRSPDYKDKAVFGVPLLLILQRTGQPLPVSIQAAISYLRSTALDSTGLFRKSGVRSRIQKLKCMNESNPTSMSYEEQQAYDVADMLKQYFRELPEALLTNKLSETFISIFQHVPEDLRLDAVQATLMLMPDENREVLKSLLEFLSEVCQRSEINQMTATNLAVCFAPSLFHLSTPRSSSSSPRRKTVGVPDLRELNENKAAYECLAFMVVNCEKLFSFSKEIITQCRISLAGCMEPFTLEEMSSLIFGQGGWANYIESCVQVLLKEAKEKYKGWINFSQCDNVDISYKKLADGHPLRLWKVSTEVEAPPTELLNRLLRERQVWDNSFSRSKVLSRLNKQTEIFQCLTSFLPPHPSCDYCIIRSWKTDLPKGACVLIESSVNHPDAEEIPGSVRAIVLASRYLIEPCGSGKSRITHISRVDTRGRSPDWYKRAYGHICSLSLIKLRNSFSYTKTSGPETKV